MNNYFYHGLGHFSLEWAWSRPVQVQFERNPANILREIQDMCYVIIYKDMCYVASATIDRITTYNNNKDKS